MNGSARRPHPFFGLFTLSLLSFIAFFSVPSHRIPHSRRDFLAFARSPQISPPFSTPTSSSSIPDPSFEASTLTSTSTSTSLSFSDSSPSESSTSTISSTTSTTTFTTTTTTTTSIRSRPRPLPPLFTPTTTVPTSEASTSASSTITPESNSFISDLTPSTTSNVGGDEPSTSTAVGSFVDPSSIATSLSHTSTSTKQFWNNKGAVAATFIFIGLLALAFAVMIITIGFKRRKARREALIEAEFMPKYQEPNSPGPSPAPSINSTPLDAFKSREVFHDQMPADVRASSMPSNSLVQDLPTIHLTPPSAFLGPSRYLLPSQSQPVPQKSAAGQLNKSDLRVSTQSGYQPSVDSFYGAYSPT